MNVCPTLLVRATSAILSHSLNYILLLSFINESQWVYLKSGIFYHHCWEAGQIHPNRDNPTKIMMVGHYGILVTLCVTSLAGQIAMKKILRTSTIFWSHMPSRLVIVWATWSTCEHEMMKVLFLDNLTW